MSSISSHPAGEPTVTVDADPAAAKLRQVADEIEHFTKTSPERLAHERTISWIRLRAHQIDGLHNPHPSEFEQAVRWLQATALAGGPDAGHARRILDDIEGDVRV